MPTEQSGDCVVEILSWDGGLHLLPASDHMPKAHRFQGGLIYSSMIEIEGRVIAPERLAGRRMRVFLSKLERWHLSRRGGAHIGVLSDRTCELPGGGLEASLFIPKDAWETAVECLSTIWRRLSLSGVEHEDGKVTILEFAFSGPAQTSASPPERQARGSTSSR
jgi:hypothetical protein